jgi:hypothetical protein
MSQGFGNESPHAHTANPHRPPARLLVVIDAGGARVARLFLESRELVTEFDAGTEEVAQMTAGLVPTRGVDGPQWDRAFAGHNAEERQAAEVYALPL